MIDVEKFEALKKKVETLKEQVAKAQGTVEATERQLIELGVTDMEMIDSFIEEKEAECSVLENDIEKEYEKLKGLHSWQFV